MLRVHGTKLCILRKTTWNKWAGTKSYARFLKFVGVYGHRCSIPIQSQLAEYNNRFIMVTDFNMAVSWHRKLFSLGETKTNGVRFRTCSHCLSSPRMSGEVSLICCPQIWEKPHHLTSAVCTSWQAFYIPLSAQRLGVCVCAQSRASGYAFTDRAALPIGILGLEC